MKTIKELDYIFILESPHVDEVKDGHPLAGKSGEAVANFLLKNDKEETFGKIVKDSYDSDDDTKSKCANSPLNNKKIAIINISNVPLQVIEKSKEVTKNIVGALEDIRKNEITMNKEGAVYLLKKFAIKFKPYCDRIGDDTTIVVCGDFARKYFDAISDDKITVEKRTETVKKEIKKKIDIIKEQKRILYVPHPSRNQWQFIDTHRENLSTLKNQF